MLNRLVRWSRVALVGAALGCGACKGEVAPTGSMPTTATAPSAIRSGASMGSSAVAAPTVNAQTRFRLEIAALKLNVFYEYRELVEKAPASIFDKPLAVLSNADVEAIDSAQEGEILLQLAPSAAARIVAIARAEMHPYRVLLDGKQVLLGVTYTEMGAAALRYLVLHYRAAGSPLQDPPRPASAVIRLFCNQGFSCSTDSAKRMPLGELRAVFPPT